MEVRNGSLPASLIVALTVKAGHLSDGTWLRLSSRYYHGICRGPRLKTVSLGDLQAQTLARRYEMESMTLLRFEHKQIASMAADLTAFVNHRISPEPLEFLALRREFGRKLATHVAQEDWVVYPGLLTHPNPRVRALATRLAADALDFSGAFRAYSRQWTTVRIAADWSGFRKETLAILARLQLRIQVEDRDLYPLVDDAGGDRHPLRPVVQAQIWDRATASPARRNAAT